MPFYTGKFERAKYITLKALKQNVEKLEFQMLGYEDLAAQHEFDQFYEKLFLDRLVSRQNAFCVKGIVSEKILLVYFKKWFELTLYGNIKKRPAYSAGRY